MFDQEIWRTRIGERLNSFARNPRQDVQLSGTVTILAYLAARTLEPFVEAFQREPVAAVLTLAEIDRRSGADHIVRRVGQMRYQLASIIERELRSTQPLRETIEQLLLTLHVVRMARQRLNSSRDEWLRLSLLSELEAYPAEFATLREMLHDQGWQARYDTIRTLRQRNGNYTPADLIMIHEALGDSASHVRAAAARLLGLFATTPPPAMISSLTHMALYDCDLETRYAAARALGSLRDRIASLELLDELARCLRDDDSFVRSAAALILSQIGETAGIPQMVANLVDLLNDEDPYAREAAARALGRMGVAASIPQVIQALTVAMQDGDSSVHEAAIDALTRLRKVRGTIPLSAHTDR